MANIRPVVSNILQQVQYFINQYVGLEMYFYRITIIVDGLFYVLKSKSINLYCTRLFHNTNCN